jgi:hypothetical protein
MRIKWAIENFAADSFVTFLQNHFPSTDAAVRRRVSRYVSFVMASARRADGIAGGTQSCLPDQYKDPTRPPTWTAVARAPDFAESRARVRSEVLQLAQSMASEKTADCERARHDFLFAFRLSNRELVLPYDLDSLYNRICL